MKLFENALHAGININDASIELIVVETAEHPAEITSHARVELPSGAIVRGSILDEHSLRQALKELRRKAGIAQQTTLSATVSVSEYLVFPFAIQKQALPQQDVPQFVKEEARHRIPIHEDEQEIFVLPDTAQTTHRIFYVLNKHIIRYYQEILQKENIQIDHIEPESVAVARFLLPAFQSQEVTRVCDIGKETSHILTLQFGMPLLSETIPLGATHLTQNGSLNLEQVNILKQELKTRIEKTPYASSALYLVGGGSLLPHIVDALSDTTLDARVGVLGHVLRHPHVPDERLRIFAHALGSALRLSSQAGGALLTRLDMLQRTRDPLLTLAQFKSRTALLLGIAGILFIVLILVGVATNKKQEVDNLTTTQTPQNEVNQSLEVFSLSTSDELLSEAVFVEQAIQETTTVETTGTNEANAKIVSESDVDTARDRLEGVLRQQLQKYFDAQTNDEQIFVFAPSETSFSSTSTPESGSESTSVTVEVNATGIALRIPRDRVVAAIERQTGDNITINSIDVSLPIFNAAIKEGTLSIRTTYTR